MRIFAFHLLNDYSGSPKVLSQLVKGWKKAGFESIVVTNKDSDGFLSDLQGIKTIHFPYKFIKNKILRLFSLLYSQIALVAILINQVKKDDIIYINTVLPFGAAILAKLKGCQVVYHIHETTVKPKVLKYFLFYLVEKMASKIVFVSEYLRDQSQLDPVRSSIILNSIEDSFLIVANAAKEKLSKPENILMVCSLKKYKGVDEFVRLAREHPNLNFRLVVNAPVQEIDAYWDPNSLPDNLEVLPTQKNVHPHYQWSHIVVNLSRPDGWIETFGLTAVEAMAYHRPVIVPPVGGITELVRDNKEGFQVDSRNSTVLSGKVKELTANQALYKEMALNSGLRVSNFKEQKMIEASISLLLQLQSQELEGFQISEHIG
ncbi:MAG: glycosyltransferase family 4 protein [Saprospiraceae bacterium]|nr:glycosyltransferase family 4 protein [Saprospiraceae bacterium]